MNNRTVLLVCAGVLTLAACSKHEAGSNNLSTDANISDQNGTATNMAATAPLSPTTAQGFVNAAAQSDKFEIESSRLAATQASSASVKKFATQMITAHTASTAKLKSTLAGMNPPVTPDDALAADQQQKLDSLKGLNGTAFDTAYASAQVEAHQKTLDTLKNYAASGDNAALKSFASGLMPTVAAHLNLAKGLK
jgi:putative membrane protein